jgi:COP9 signalosome complex subunit 1
MVFAISVYTQLLAPGDIAVYGVLCALASFTRNQLKARVLDNDGFGVYIEQEPYVRDLLDAYMASRFKQVLELLEKFSVRAFSPILLLTHLLYPPPPHLLYLLLILIQTRHYADIHLAAHVHDLTALIRDRALVLYFTPFASIRLERMSVAFGWGVDEVERAVVALIQAGEIKGRVDSQNKVRRLSQLPPVRQG